MQHASTQLFSAFTTRSKVSMRFSETKDRILRFFIRYSDKSAVLMGTLLLVCTSVCFAQTDLGTIRGRVLDSASALVSGATVIATNLNTNVAQSTISNQSGIYSITALPPGMYRVQVSAPGFKTYIQNSVVVNLGGVTGLDVQLAVGAAAETITVSSNDQVLETQQSDVNTTVPTEAFADLPLSAGGGRTVTAFRALVPGVAISGTVNGGPEFGGDIQVDGASDQTGELFGDNRNIRFPPDAVNELSLTTAAYAAEYGTTGDGVERYEIKSGTNQLHGSAYEYLKNTVFDARGFFNTTTPVDHQNEFGFTAGGPVWIPKLYNGHNKTFFFFDGDWYRQSAAGAITTISLPNVAFRNGDFSQLLASGQIIYDPATTQPDGSGGYTRTPFPGNVIDQDRFSPIAKKILSFVPASTTQAVLNNTLVPAEPSYNNYNTYTMKGDEYITQHHHVSGTLIYSANPFGGGSLLPPPIQDAVDYRFTYTLARVSYDWTISSQLLNQLRLAYNRQNFIIDTQVDTSQDWPEQLGLNGFSTASGIFPAIVPGAYTVWGTGAGYDHEVSNTYILSDALSYTRGQHSMKFGVEIRDIRHGIVLDYPALLSFSRNETAYPTSTGFNTTGSEIASLLLGQVDGSSIQEYNGISPNYYWKNIAGYAQDDFKITPKLTINYGLRFTILTPMAARHNQFSIMDLRAQNPVADNLLGAYVFAGRDGQGRNLSYAKQNIFELSPRFGVAYTLFPRLIVRAGYGISSFPTGAYGSGNNVFLVDGFSAVSTATSPNQGIEPAFDLDQGFPQDKISVPQLTSSFGIGQNFNYFAPTAGRSAQMQSWNLSTQFLLAPNLTLDVAYVGTVGSTLTLRGNVNQLNPGYLSLGDNLLRSSITDPAVVTAGFNAPWPGFSNALGANATLAQALRPYPQFMTGAADSTDTRGNSSYNALQAKLEKHYSNGLYVLGSYTWNKYLTNANNTYDGFAGVIRNQYDPALDRTVGDSWVPNNLTIAFNYQLPFGSGMRFLGDVGSLTNRIISGWQLNGILSYHSGALISLPVPNTLPLFAGPMYANILPGQSLKGDFHGDPRTAHYLNINAFTLPAPDTFGTGGKYLPNLRAPAYADEDIGLIKRVPIKDSLNLELRIEAFNLFNRTVFASPATDITNPSTFGNITAAANAARTAQFVAKINF